MNADSHRGPGWWATTKFPLHGETICGTQQPTISRPVFWIHRQDAYRVWRGNAMSCASALLMLMATGCGHGVRHPGSRPPLEPVVSPGEIPQPISVGLPEFVRQSGHSQAISSAAFDPSGRRLVTASADGTAKVWDVATGVLWATLEGHDQEVAAVSFSPDGRAIVTASRDGTAKIWDSGTGSLRIPRIVITKIAAS